MNQASESPSPPFPDPDLLARWIAIAQLLASAEELQGRRGGAWPGLALVTADTANEAVLGLIAAAGDNPPPERAAFDDVYGRAVEALRAREHEMSHSLRTRVLQLHRARNSAVHLGVEPSRRQVESGLRTARELRALAVSATDALQAFAQSGPVRAVADLVGIAEISEPLGEAEDALRQENVSGAADKTAIALDAAFARVKPGLRSWRSQHIWAVRGMDLDLTRAVEALVDRVERLEVWTLAIGVGLLPRELVRLRATVGVPVYTLGGPQPHSISRDKTIVLTRPIVEWALFLTADVIYRLWQDDSLRTGDSSMDE